MNRLSKRIEAVETKSGKGPGIYENVYSYVINEGDPEPPEHGPNDLVIVRVIVVPPERDTITGERLSPPPPKSRGLSK